MKVQLVYKKGTVLATEKTGADIEVVECGRFVSDGDRLYFFRQTDDEVQEAILEDNYRKIKPPFRSVAEDQLADWSVLEEKEETDGQG